MKRLKRYFLTGLIVVVPVSLTIYVLVAAFQFIDGILGSLFNVYLKNKLGFYIPGLGFLLFIMLLVVIGFLATRIVGRKIFPRIEKWFSELPLIKTIYPALKQIVLFGLEQKELGFKKVVLVEYPSKDIWSLGFLTNDQFKKINDITGKEMVAVFLPTTPGPISGYVVFIQKDSVRFTDIPVSDALKIIISGGVFKP